jgi:DNA-binding response OmpR family regulator
MGLTRVTLQTNAELLFEGTDGLCVREALAACQMLGIAAQRAIHVNAAEARRSFLAHRHELDMWILVALANATARVKELRAMGFAACVYVVDSADARSESEASVLDAGADGYSATPIEQSTLTARFRSTLRRKSGNYLARKTAKVQLQQHERVLLVGSTEYQLSPRELALIEYLQKRAGRWVRRNELTQDVFGAQNGYDSSLLRTHVLNIRKKLGTDAWLLRTDRLEGLMLAVGLEVVEGEKESGPIGC